MFSRYKMFKSDTFKHFKLIDGQHEIDETIRCLVKRYVYNLSQYDDCN